MQPTTGSEPGRPLIGRLELAGLLESGRPPVLLDVRWRLGGPPGIDSYLAGHLPGACFIDLDADLAAPPGAGGRHPLPDPAIFEGAMRRAGLRAGGDVVVYDDADATIAARLWWMLRYHGHQQVRVLDGGYLAWAAGGLPVTEALAPAPATGDFAAAPGGLAVLDADGAARLARTGFLLDARAAARYRGEIEPVDPAAGHIPGAISAPASENVGPDGCFLSPARLRERFAALGLPADGEPVASAELAAGAGGTPLIGAYCGSGVTAAQAVLALEVAGLPAALYVGSWSQWSADTGRPVATGSARG